jgi:hypothetical protein
MFTSLKPKIYCPFPFKKVAVGPTYREEDFVVIFSLMSIQIMEKRKHLFHRHG